MTKMIGTDPNAPSQPLDEAVLNRTKRLKQAAMSVPLPLLLCFRLPEQRKLDKAGVAVELNTRVRHLLDGKSFAQWTPEQAVEHAHLGLLQLMRKKNQLGEPQPLSNLALKLDRLVIVQWFHNSFNVLPESTAMDHAAKQGVSTQTLQWAHDHGVQFTLPNIDIIMNERHYETARWLYQVHQLPVTSDCITCLDDNLHATSDEAMDALLSVCADLHHIRPFSQTMLNDIVHLAVTFAFLPGFSVEKLLHFVLARGAQFNNSPYFPYMFKPRIASVAYH